MRYLSAGYLVVGITPLLSTLLLMLVRVEARNYLLPIMVHTGESALIVAMEVCGIILYVIGYKRKEMQHKEAKFILISGILLVLFGLFQLVLAIGFYSETIRWSVMPEIRELTIWDHLRYIIRGLEAGLWMVSGALFTTTAYMHELVLKN